MYTRGIGFALGRLSMIRCSCCGCFVGRGAAVPGPPGSLWASPRWTPPWLPLKAAAAARGKSSPCGTAPRPMAGRTCRRWAGPWPPFFLRPCAFERLVVFGRRQARCPRSLRPGPAGRAAGRPAARSLPRRSRAGFALLWPGHARRVSKLAGRVPRAGSAGPPWPRNPGPAWRAARPRCWRRICPAAGRRAGTAALLLLGPYDPYLDVHGPREEGPVAARRRPAQSRVANRFELRACCCRSGPLRACGAKAHRAKALRFALRCLPRFLRPGARRCRRWHSAMPPSAASPLRPARWKSNIQFVFFILLYYLLVRQAHWAKEHKKCACILVTLPPCRLAQTGYNRATGPAGHAATKEVWANEK